MMHYAGIYTGYEWRNESGASYGFCYWRGGEEASGLDYLDNQFGSMKNSERNAKNERYNESVRNDRSKTA